MSLLTIFLFVWGFGVSLYLIIVGLSRLIAENVNSKIDKIDKDIRQLELTLKQDNK